MSRVEMLAVLLLRKLRFLESAIDRATQFKDCASLDDSAFFSRFYNKNLASVMGLFDDNRSHATVITTANKMLHGLRPVSDDQLKRISKYYELENVLPDGWRMLRDDFGMQAFVEAVYGTMYGVFGAMDFRQFPALRFLKPLMEMGMERTGIEFDHLSEEDTHRAAESDDEATWSHDIELFSFGDLYRLRIDLGIGTFTLVEVVSGLAYPPGYEVRVLAPSYRHPVTRVSGTTVIPTVSGRNGITAFKVGMQLGRVDYVATITDHPILPDQLLGWRPGSFAVMQSNEEQEFISALGRAAFSSRRIGRASAIVR